MTRRTFIQSTGTAAAAQVVRGANDKIQLGFIGCGARAHELMRAVMANSGVEITNVCDAYTGRVQRALERIGGSVKSRPDYHEILADKAVDAVVIATPDHWHKTMILQALAAGKDVYCEKPMTYTAQEGAEITEAVRKSGRVLQIGSQGISSAMQQKAKEIIQSGKLGQITMVRSAYNRNTASGAWIYPIPPDASPKTVNWEAFLGPAPKRPYSPERFFRWRCFEDYSGGIATDLFVHLCTTIHYLMDAKVPGRAIALGQLYRWKENREVPDTINAVLEYPEGFAVNLSSTFNNESASEGSFTFLGTQGSLSIGTNLVFTPEVVNENNRWIVESWPKAMEDAYYQDPKVKQAETRRPRRKGIDDPLVIKGERGDSTIPHMGHFLDSIRTRKPYWEDATAGHHAAACAHMVNLSAKEKRLVEWDFSRDTIKA